MVLPFNVVASTPSPARQVRLRVHIHDERPFLGSGHRRAYVDGGRGLTHPAFLVRDGDDGWHGYGLDSLGMGADSRFRD